MIESFGFLNFENGISLNPDIFWGLFAVLLLVFLTVSLMLNHHWKYYGIKDNPKVFAKNLYWIISVFLIVLIAFSIAAYESKFLM
jgi:hypothetical protein